MLLCECVSLVKVGSNASNVRQQHRDKHHVMSQVEGLLRLLYRSYRQYLLALVEAGHSLL